MVQRQILRCFITTILFILTLINVSREARCAGFAGTRSMTVARYMHTATLLHNSQLLITGGHDGSTAVSSTELYDSSTGRFTATGSMSVARYVHTATILPNGKVLVTGGCVVNDSTILSSAELYDTATGAFTPTGSMTIPRRNHTATLLQNGKVLIVGGFNGSAIVNSAEVYDPATGVFTPTGSLAVARHVHNATRLQNGKILITGGWGESGSAGLRSAELYDPATGSFSATGGMIEARWGYTATALSNGKVLVAGGNNGTTPLTGAELYDPVTGTFSATGALAAGRYAHAAVLLPNGNVLVAGGNDGASGLKSLEAYNPVTGTFTTISGSMAVARAACTATLLANGEVVVSGGTGSALEGPGAVVLNSADVYDPANGSFAATGSMADARYYLHTSTPLQDGKILIAGGSILWPSSVLKGAELYDPAADAFSSIPGGMITSRSWHTATLLPNGKVLVSGGWNDSPLAGAELYDPAATAFSATGSMIAARHAHTATLLPNGKVLIAGGSNAGDFLNSAEIYDPATGTFAPTGNMTMARAAHTATLLANGKVLITGGHLQAATVLRSAEIYDPATGTFNTTGNMTYARTLHTATLLPNYKVLITGGYDNTSYLGNAELYNPDTGTFGGTGGMTNTRCYHAATLLPNGKVLITGGYTGDVVLSSTELFDPATEAFQPAANMTEVRNGHTAALLSNGRVLVAGGWGSDLLNSAELYDVGLGYTENRRPVINNVILGEGTLLLSGTGFSGGSITSGGASDNSSGHPILMLQRLDNGMTSFLLPDPAALWSDTSLTSILPDLPAGSYQATVFTNAVPSVSAFFTVSSLPEAVNGACGNSDGATFTATPTTGLCTFGTASGVSGSGPWSWTCAGLNGGSTAACSATIQTYIITFAGDSHGSLTGLTSQIVSHGGSTTAVTAVPAFGYHFVNWTDSNGFVSTANPLKVSNVTSDMTFTAHYIVNTITLGLSEYTTVKKINGAISYPSAVQMQFSFDNVKWKKWEKYSTTKVLSVPSKDGVKTVFCRFKDGSGNISATYSDTVLLDTKAPKGTIKINGGGLNTKDRDITLQVSATDLTSGISGICIKESTAACSNGEFVPVATSMTYRLTSPGDGKKKVYAVFRDVAGKVSKAVSAGITLDTAAPTGTILINKGEPTTTDPEVKLKLSGVKVSHMQLSLDGGATWGNWEKFASSRKVRLTSGAGEKTLVVRFRDLSGNVSPDYSAKITLADG